MRGGHKRTRPYKEEEQKDFITENILQELSGIAETKLLGNIINMEV
jgi:hypothetical protein